MSPEEQSTPPPTPPLSPSPPPAPATPPPTSPSPAEPQNTKASKKKFGCGPAVVIMLGVALAGSVFINLILTMALGSMGASQIPTGDTDENPVFGEQLAWGDENGTRVLHVTLEGAIMREPSGGGFFPSRYDRVEMIIRQIRAARNDSSIEAILLEVNSPGGALTPTDEIYDALLRFKNEQSGRQIIVFMRDLAASGGYYAAMASDWIVAEPTTIIGSIGVIMPSYNLKGLGDKLGITDGSIKSGQNKDLFNPLLDPESEAYQKQKMILQDMVDMSYERFLDIVAEGRNLEEAEVRPLADGRIFNAPVALDHKLIDEIGYWEDAISITRKKLGGGAIALIRYQAANSFADLLMGIEAPTINVEVKATPEGVGILQSQIPAPQAR